MTQQKEWKRNGLVCTMADSTWWWNSLMRAFHTLLLLLKYTHGNVSHVQRTVSSPGSSLQTPGSVRWTTLEVTSFCCVTTSIAQAFRSNAPSLSVSSFLFQSQHLEWVLPHFALSHFVGWLSNESRGSASWVTCGPWAQEVKVYASSIDAACQAQVINVARDWVESRNAKWIICQFCCRYQSWRRWDFAAVPHMEAYNQIPHGIFKNDIEWTLLTFNKSNFDSDTIKIKEGEHTEFSL